MPRSNVRRRSVEASERDVGLCHGTIFCAWVYESAHIASFFSVSHTSV